MRRMIVGNLFAKNSSDLYSIANQMLPVTEAGQIKCEQTKILLTSYASPTSDSWDTTIPKEESHWWVGSRVTACGRWYDLEEAAAKARGNHIFQDNLNWTINLDANHFSVVKFLFPFSSASYVPFIGLPLYSLWAARRERINEEYNIRSNHFAQTIIRSLLKDV